MLPHPEHMNLEALCVEMSRRARKGATVLASLPSAVKDRWLGLLAGQLREKVSTLLEANATDLKAAEAAGMNSAMLDRLKLTPSRLEGMATAVQEVAALRDPIGQIREGSVRPNGLQVQKVTVPLGVIFFLYESRPNVTIDAAALCVKSGNAVILRGGKEAAHTNQALYQLIASSLAEVGLPAEVVQMVPTLDREAVGIFLKQDQWIDLVIPRGGESLIRRVVDEARMPVLKHYRGNCHVYVDQFADLAMAEQIVLNAKCQRPSVCNAMESLLVHEAIAETFLRSVGPLLNQRGVALRACPISQVWLPGSVSAKEDDYAAEYCDLILSIKVVPNIEAAIIHIDRYGSRHTDAIVTRDLASARRFIQAVDSAAVMVNASTRFNDGYELGLGAEIGISTDKLHARGPCGLQELTTYKYVVFGDGHIRE